jgi:polyisoprenoid-binding protein YceI
MAKRIAVLVFAFLAIAVTSNADQWKLDKPHSSVNFSVRHLVISRTNGSFGDFDGKITFDGKNWDKAAVEMTVQTASINTADKKRDEHLRSADFLEVEKFPTMTFKSKKVVKGEAGEFQVIGDLTIKDVTKEVTFDCEFFGLVEFMGETRAGFTAATKINRQDFNVSWNKTLDAGGVVVGDEVSITLEIEAIKVG